jgi:hypothetical protein
MALAGIRLQRLSPVRYLPGRNPARAPKIRRTFAAGIQFRQYPPPFLLPRSPRVVSRLYRFHDPVLLSRIMIAQSAARN